MFVRSVILHITESDQSPCCLHEDLHLLHNFQIMDISGFRKVSRARSGLMKLIKKIEWMACLRGIQKYSFVVVFVC